MSEKPKRQIVEIEAPVTEVTLTEDRARVVRRGIVTLPRGEVTLEIHDVSPLLVNKTLQTTVRQTDGGETKDVRVFDSRPKRQKINSSELRSDELRALAAEAEVLALEEADLKGRIQLLSRQAEVVGQVVGTTIHEMSEDASIGFTDPGEWGGQLGKLSERERELRAEVLERSFQWQELKAKSRRLTTRREAAAQPGWEMRASIESDLSVASEGDYEVEIDYVVPGACWRPYHRATLKENEDAGEVELSCEACVWQQTGEDWSDVDLLFSTARPSLGVEPPLLENDTIRVRRKSETVDVQVRQQTVHTTGLGSEPSAVIPEVPGIDDGGVPLSLEAAQKATIPSDGQPYRTPVFSFLSPTEGELLVAPEILPAAIYKTVQHNAAALPILAGPVDLIRRGGLVGRTSVLFIAPGERFPLSWGPEGELRVAREVEDQEEERGMLSSWIKQAHLVKVRLSNIGARNTALTVKERIPVSEIDKVKISVDAAKTTDAVEPDDDGFLTWRVELPPFSREKLELRYTIKRHRDVVGL